MIWLTTVKEVLASGLPEELWDRAMALQMFKIVIGFHQVVSSFFNFNVKWPDLFAQLFRIAENLNFNFLSIPSVGCVALGVTYETKLIVFTIAPFLILFLIILPRAIAKLLLGRKLEEALWKDRYERAKVTMCSNILFFIILVYPMLSSTTLTGLHCRDFGPPMPQLLVSDVRVTCPWAQGGSNFLFMYTSIFVFIFPFGSRISSLFRKPVRI